MNAFVHLRQQLHSRYSSPAERDIALAGELMTPGLAGQPAVRHLLEARALAEHPDPQKLSNLWREHDDDALILRYLADSLTGAHSRPSAAGIIREAPVSMEGQLNMASETGVPAFEQREIIRYLTGNPDSAGLRAVLAYIEVFPDPEYAAFLEDIGNNAGGDTTMLSAWYAKAAVSPETVGMEEADRWTQPFAAARNHPSRPLVLQTVFHGDPGRPGKRGSGGIGTLVLRLGNALAADGNPVVTATPSTHDTSDDAPAVEQLVPDHALYRIPIPMTTDGPESLLHHRPAIGRAFAGLLGPGRLRPRSVHVRFLDDASLAVARVAAGRQIPCAVTLTPDPHRSFVEADGSLRQADTRAGLLSVHRIWIGDELTRLCRGMMAIGRNTMKDEILGYFPQTEQVRGRVFASVDEGVPGPPEVIGIDVPALLTGGAPQSGLAPDRLPEPTILSVGRLAPVKNFPALARAWSDGLWKSHNLVIIGGDFDTPTPDELKERKLVAEALAAAPAQAAGRCVHLPGQPSETVARIEAWFGRRPSARIPDLYVAASLKEEFGLAILEAMAAGMVACAPIRGGAGTYIRSGVNGFLVDTSDALSLRRDLESILAGLVAGPGRIDAIRSSARETVSAGYSMPAMSRRYADFYRRITGETDQSVPEGSF